MATELRPTWQRLQLLRLMGEGAVWEDWNSDEPGEITYRWAGREWRGTAKVRQMKTAGWCRTEPEDHGLHGRRVTLTDAGREVLRLGTVVQVDTTRKG